MNILERNCGRRRGNGSKTEKRQTPTEELIRSRCEAGRARRKAERFRETFHEALKKPGMSYICEVKKASPSKGLIALGFPVSGHCQRV